MQYQLLHFGYLPKRFTIANFAFLILLDSAVINSLTANVSCQVFEDSDGSSGCFLIHRNLFVGFGSSSGPPSCGNFVFAVSCCHLLREVESKDQQTFGSLWPKSYSTDFKAIAPPPTS